MKRYALITILSILCASCKTADVRQSWSPVTHRVNGDRLTCVSYEGRTGDLIRTTEETEIIWALKPGDYLFSVQSTDCKGLVSGFTDPIKFTVIGE